MQGRGPIKLVPKQWGREEWLANEPRYCLKRLVLAPGYTCSLHLHPVKQETFIVQTGECWLSVGDLARRMQPGDWALVPRGTKHRFWNTGLYETVILEVSTHHDDEDCIRFEQSRQLREGEL